MKQALLIGRVTVPPTLRFADDASAFLDQVVHEGECRSYGCSNTLKATVRDMLAQKNVGSDYEDGADGGAVNCSECGGGAYVSFLCHGKVSA